MRKNLSILVLLGASLSFASCAEAHLVPGPLKVAAILSLSGSAGELGSAALKGLQLSVEQINARGGMLGHSFEIVHEDDASDPKKSEEIARRLATPGSADLIIGGSTTRTSLAIAAVAERARIPFIALGGCSSITPVSRRWVFQTPPTEAHAIARVMADMAKRGIKRVGLIVEDSDFGERGRREVRDLTHPQGLGMRRYGIRLSLDLAYPPAAPNISARLATLSKSSDIDALFIYGAGDGAVQVLQELRRLGSKLPAYQSHAMAGYEFLKLAGDAAEGVRLPGPSVLAADLLAADDPRKALVMEFIAAFRARFGERPSSSAGYAYDAFNIGADAIGRASSADFEIMRRAIELTQDFAGVTGTYSMRADNHAGLDDEKALLLLEVKDGAFRLAN